MADVETVAQKVDLDSLDASLVEEKIEINPDVNPLEAPPPVDDGVHRVKLVGDATSWEASETKEDRSGNRRAYLKTKFSGVVIAEGTKNHNKRVFGRVNTLVFEGKSEMGYILLQIYGGKSDPQARAKVEALTNYVALATAFRDALAGEPIIKVSTKWLARYNAGTKESQDWKTYLSGQGNFPSDGANGKRHIVSVKGAGEISAQAEIQDYFPDK